MDRNSHIKFGILPNRPKSRKLLKLPQFHQQKCCTEARIAFPSSSIFSIRLPSVLYSVFAFYWHTQSSNFSYRLHYCRWIT